MSRFTWMIAVSIALAATVGALGSGFTVMGLPRLVIIGAVLGLAAYRFRRIESFRLCLSALALAVVFSSGFVVLTYMAARMAPPLIDDWLIRCDRWLGFSTLRPWQYTHAGILLAIAYYSLLLQTTATIAVLGLRNQREPLERFFQQMMVAGVIALGCFLFMPAVGPCVVAPSADQAHYLEHFWELRAGARTTLSFADAEGLITFPSFHTVWALLLVAACPRPLKAASVVLNATVIVATLTTGWHYLSDVLAGILVYYVVCWLLSDHVGARIRGSSATAAPMWQDNQWSPFTG
jgi:membrane-associated phospholipid phosphatase